MQWCVYRLDVRDLPHPVSGVKIAWHVVQVLGHRGAPVPHLILCRRACIQHITYDNHNS